MSKNFLLAPTQRARDHVKDFTNFEGSNKAPLAMSFELAFRVLIAQDCFSALMLRQTSPTLLRHNWVKQIKLHHLMKKRISTSNWIECHVKILDRRWMRNRHNRNTSSRTEYISSPSLAARSHDPIFFSFFLRRLLPFALLQRLCFFIFPAIAFFSNGHIPCWARPAPLHRVTPHVGPARTLTCHSRKLFCQLCCFRIAPGGLFGARCPHNSPERSESCCECSEIREGDVLEVCVCVLLGRLPSFEAFWGMQQLLVKWVSRKKPTATMATSTTPPVSVSNLRFLWWILLWWSWVQ